MTVCFTAQAQDKDVFAFSFAPNSSNLLLEQGNNRVELQRLRTAVKAQYSSIVADTLAIFVRGYYNIRSGESRRQARERAKIRSNRVKSALIEQAGMLEEFFITANRLSDHSGANNVVHVVIRIPTCEERLQENIAHRRKKGLPIYECLDTVETTVIAPEEKQQLKKDSVEVVPEEKSAVPQKFSIRTNLLYWIAAVPNFGIEYRFPLPYGEGQERAISILLNGGWSHWIWKDKHRQYSNYFVQPEIRYYFCKRWFVGVEGHFGQVNVKLEDEGIQGDFIGGGLTGGYRLPLSRYFDMDFSLGLGYIQLDYMKYTRSNDVFVLKEDNLNKSVLLPTQAGISLIFKL
ncbi:MAG: DUF3575 domain-containing protein [Prevotellaceae bacterium]|nr:DUF3575 domain-containing protein [Prevotellaceae bacterium]